MFMNFVYIVPGIRRGFILYYKGKGELVLTMRNQLEDLDEIAKQIMQRLQDGLPLTERPFAEIAQELGTTEETVLNTIEKLMEQGLIRRLSGFFEPRRLGYTSTLCGMKVPKNELHSVAAVINEFPEVTHNYWRNNQQYNLWFTIIAQGEQGIGRIRREIEASTFYPVTDFAATRFFKIQVRFHVVKVPKESTLENPAEPLLPVRPMRRTEQCLIHALGANIPLVQQPYQALAGILEKEYAWPEAISGSQVIALAKALQQEGYLRRIGAVIKHTQIGYNTNWMVVWQVPDERVEQVGNAFVAEQAVSHCYCRKRQKDWPWNLYTMLHAANVGEAKALVAGLQAATGIEDYIILPTIEELKKTGMRYFPESKKENKFYKG